MAKPGFLSRSGQIVDVSIIKAPIRRTGKREMMNGLKKAKNLKIKRNDQNLKKIGCANLRIPSLFLLC